MFLVLVVATLTSGGLASAWEDGWTTESICGPNNSANTGWKPSPPGTWICYTTAGSVDLHGGHANSSKCDNATSSGDVWIGWVGVVIAVVFFGSNFIPVKKFDSGDGIFFQWMLCIGIWLVGLVANMARDQPPFLLPSLLGGFLWTTGNLLTVSIIKMIGLTMGLTVWGVTNMLAGWLTGKVILNESVTCAPLNYSAVAIVFISVVILAFVKSTGKKASEPGGVSEATPLISDQDSLEGSLRDKVVRESRPSNIQRSSDKLTFSPSVVQNGGMGAQEWNEYDEDYSWTDRLGVWPQRILGFSLAMVAGLFFGVQFIFIEFMKMCTDQTHSCSDIDYVFGHYSGILVASTFYFIIYCVVMKNRPRVYPRIILPGLISGIMWGVAMVGWFLANQRLSLAVSFPIITAGPGFVSSAWGIFIFREIRGWKNIILYAVSFAVSLSGQVLDGLSKTTVTCHSK